MELLVLLCIPILIIVLPRKIAHWQIMSHYDKSSGKIKMTSDTFFNIRHRGGYHENNGLFFRDGYMKPPVYHNGNEYIEVELID